LKKFNSTMKIPLPVLAVSVSKPWAMNYELTCSQSGSLIAQNLVDEKKLIRNKPLPVSALAVSKPRAMSCELAFSQSSSLIAQNTIKEENIKMEKTSAGTGSGCEQALGHGL
jgi:hypothetical protein